MSPTLTPSLVSKITGEVGESVSELHETLVSVLRSSDTRAFKAAGHELLEQIRHQFEEHPFRMLATAVVLGVAWQRLLLIPGFRLGVAKGLGTLVTSAVLNPLSEKSQKRPTLTH